MGSAETKRPEVAQLSRPEQLPQDIRLPPGAQERMQEALEGILQPLIDVMPLALNSLDREGRVAAWNAAAERMFGWSAAEVMGQPLPTVPPEAWARYQAHRESALTNLFPQGELAQRRRKDGTEVWVRLWTSRVFTSDGQLVAVVGLLSDETARKQQEDREVRAAVHARLLKEVAIAANESDSLEPALRRALGVVCCATGWKLGHALVLEEGELRETAIWTNSSQPPNRYDAFARAMETTQQRRGEGLAGKVVASGEPAWNLALGQSPEFSPWKEAVTAGLHAGIAIPLTVRGEVVAVMEFYCEQATGPDPALVEVLLKAGQQLGRVVERLRLYREQLHSDQAGRRADVEATEVRRRALLEALSRRELSVLSLLAEGSDNLKIAAMLDISERTVKTHVSALLRKLSVENRTQAALLAHTAGLGRGAF